MVVVAQLVRAPDCGSGGRRFETDLPPKMKEVLSKAIPLFFIFLFTSLKFYLYICIYNNCIYIICYEKY